MFFVNVPFERTGVHPDADRDLPLTAGTHDLRDLLAGADVAGIYPDLVRPGGNRREGDLIIEMDVGDERYFHALCLQRAKNLCRLRIGDGETDDVTPLTLECPYLRERCLCVVRVGIGHRLDQNRRAATERQVADGKRTRFFSYDPVFFFLLYHNSAPFPSPPENVGVMTESVRKSV